ncbi:MAG TPA: hypothetical protein DER40_17035 [Geobacter sp.]|nr:hypothetical protein [Geobacter sp.]HCE69135.1 hypothetical protein [Geobacter sp.]
MMLDNNNDLGAALFKTWTEKQRCDEIQKLVEGYRKGVPVGILCKMSETIAGDKKKARKYLKLFLTDAERKAAIGSANASMLPLISSFMK